jgi:hypothetical protein
MEEGCQRPASVDDHGAKFCRRHYLINRIMLVLGIIGVLALFVFAYLLVSPEPFP